MENGGGRKRDSQVLKGVLGVRDLVLGISRTPLRAALARLEQEGLLEQIPSGGYSVRGFSIADVYDALELRGVLEGTAARLAAERGVAPAKLRSIKLLVDELDGCFRDRPEDMLFQQYVELNAEFHAMLAGLAGSPIIRREIERVVQLPFASPSAFLMKQEDVLAFRLSLVHAQRQHREMVTAIELREGTRAEALAREHARLARHNLEFVINEDRSLMARVPGLALLSA